MSTLSRKIVSFSQSETLLCFRVSVGLELGLGLELAEIRFWSNVFSSMCSRSK